MLDTETVERRQLLKMTSITVGVVGWSGVNQLKSTICVSTVCVKSLQSCPILCKPMGYSLPGSPALGILQARILKLVPISSSRESS